MVHPHVLSTVGGTPLVELSRFALGIPVRMMAKLEMRNPAGSVKDRIGAALIREAEAQGLERGGTVIEATGGNTGIGLAMAAAVGGYRLILTMPDVMSRERVALLRFMGAEIHLTSGISMVDAVALAQELHASCPGSFLVDRFTNGANADTHLLTTGPEILRDADGRVDYLVCAVGTGGTITGVGRALRRANPDAVIVAVEPAGSAVLSGGPPGPHRMPGIGVGFVPPILELGLIDEVIAVRDEDAFRTVDEVARREGILAGVSSGSALWAARVVAMRPAARGATIVVVLADSAERYITTDLFAGGAARRAIS